MDSIKPPRLYREVNMRESKTRKYRMVRGLEGKEVPRAEGAGKNRAEGRDRE